MFCILGFALSNGRGETTLDAETEAVFTQLETALNDKQQNKENQEEIKKLIQDVKDEMAKKDPEYGKKVLGMTKSLAGAVPKLKSTNELTVAEGALLVVAGVAEHFPPPVGIVVASLATLVSSVLGYLTPQKVIIHSYSPLQLIIIIIIIPYFHRVIQSAINIAAIKRSPV